MGTGDLIIGGKRLASAQRISSINPATMETVGEASLAGWDLCAEALEAARKAYPAWRMTPPAEKKKIFKRAEKILLRRSAEAARLIALEKGSPYPESLAVEVFGALQAFSYYAGEGGNLLKPRRASHHVPLFLNKKSSFHFHPLGPALIISPWNFPLLIPCCDVLSALTAGNTVILRPSTLTPLIALLLGEVFLEAGLPEGVLNVVVCRVPEAERIITHPTVQAVMFTGSVSVGKRIMELASRNLPSLTLELGGKDPMLVLEDADLERAAKGAVWAAFMNCGQSCGSVERVYVDARVADEFTRLVLDETRKIRVGNPLEPGIDMGPMASSGQREAVEGHIAEAREKGARILYGGGRPPGLPGYFLEPTVLSGVDHSMKIMSEETFGPTLPIMSFSGLEEAVALGNDSLYGLTASVWTRSPSQAAWLSERLEAGTVTVNDHMFSFTEPRAIWGGIKQTGLGRCHGLFGLHEIMNIKYVSQDFSRKPSQLWWFPYNESLGRLLEKALVVYHDDRLGKKLGTVLSLLSHWPRIRSTSPLGNFVKSFPRILKK